MGIPYYFASLIKSHSGIVRPVKNKIRSDILCFDFNCLIHRYLDDANPIESILEAFSKILDTVCDARVIYVALDGLVPYAKIVQQRYRRMAIKSEGVFDRNQISPCTPYMRELEEKLKSRFPNIIVSGTDEPGEGEHKMMMYLKEHRLENKSITIYGLDADLILICLQNHYLSAKNEMLLLRESSEMGVKPDEFATMNIWGLLEQLPIPISQYIPLSILCFGNDFMPNLAIFSLREGGYERALTFYEASGNPDLNTEDGRAIFLDYAELHEMNILRERISHRRRPEEKALLGKSPELFVKKYRMFILEGVENIEPVIDAFWKTFHWTLDYFIKNEPVNWDWYYPYSDAPLILDLVQFEETNPVKQGFLNFNVTNQLQMILPKKSLRTARRLIKFQDEKYVETRNPWMKRFDWEMKPYVSLPWHPTFNQTSFAQLEV